MKIQKAKKLGIIYQNYHLVPPGKFNGNGQLNKHNSFKGL